MEETLNNKQKSTTDNKRYKTLSHHNPNTNNTLQRHLKNKTSHNKKQEKYTSTDVYELKCNDCPKFYIGQTGRSFKT
jgi:hypothetical protein